MLRIERGIRLGSKYLAATSESAVTMLAQHLGLLGNYVAASNNRILVQQIADSLMEDLLELKAKLIDFALNYSIPSIST